MNLPATVTHSDARHGGSWPARALFIPHDVSRVGEPSFFNEKDGETRGGVMNRQGTDNIERKHRQRDMPMVSAIGAPRLLDTYLVDTCQSATQAIALTARYGGFKDRDLAAMLDCAPGTLSKYLTGGGANPSLDRLVDLMHVCRNLGALQYLAHRMHCDVVLRETIDTDADESTEARRDTA